MADTYGETFPTMSVSRGHIFQSTITGGTYIYIDGDVTDTDVNWMLVGGNLSADPDTSRWTSRQAGATWYNTSDSNRKGWDGSQIVIQG
jgi:hypothetical protein